jgi:hypothetical protein
MGECDVVAAGNPDPHGQCVTEAKSTCGSSGLCNGLGGCAKFAAGTECVPASCTNGVETPTATCDGEGHCQMGTPIPCSPFLCAGSTACRATCTTNADCVAPNVCTDGSCGARPNGQSCKVASDCQSGFCVDGYCCNNACTGTCVSCGLSNNRGKCTNVPSGTTDPRGTCKDMGAASCGTNGKCNGNKACQTYPNGTKCKDPSCSTATNQATQTSTCQSGKCSTPNAIGCTPFKCGGTACATSCVTNADCVAPNLCDPISKKCGKLPDGVKCSANTDCQNNNCVDGYCCENACAGTCFSCGLEGSLGKCTAIGDGKEHPTKKCTKQLESSCGNDGLCDGAGACRKWPATTVCAAASCTNGTATAASKCDGKGACVAGATTTCDPYTCDDATKTCHTSCSGTGPRPECKAPNICKDTFCGAKKPDGASCTVGAECISEVCVNVGGNMICCNDACTGACKACNVSGKCENTPNGGDDPKGMCAAQPASSCGTDGKCDGAGACRKHPNNTPCADQTCTGGQLTAESKCMGGTCTAPAPMSCATGSCSGNACAAPKANGQACTSNGECASGACVGPNGGKICCASSCSDETGSNPCGNTGVCEADGSACKKVASGTNCSSCVGGQAQAATCNGSGMCVNMGSPQACDPTCTGDGKVQARQCVNGACTNNGAATACAPVCMGGSLQARTCMAGACADDGAAMVCANGCADMTSCAP